MIERLIPFFAAAVLVSAVTPTSAQTTKAPPKSVPKAAAKAAAAAAPPAAAAAASEMPVQTQIANMHMFLGEVKTLPVTEVLRVAVGNGKIVSSTVLETNELLLLAENAGETSLYVWQRNGPLLRYKIRVTATDPDDTLQQVQGMLKGMPGVQVQKTGDNVVLSGTVSRINLARVAEAVRNYRVVNLVREEEVTMKKMVHMKVQILELRKSAMENLGVDWTTSINGPAGALTSDVISNRQFRFAPQTQDPTFQVGGGAAQALSIPSQAGRAYLGIATTITSRINLAVQNGDAWVLAAPELSTRSGGESKFLAGGQVPLPTVSATGQSSVTFKDYGIRLTLKPVADDQNNISAAIQTELSAIDPSVTVNGIPGFTTRQTESEINVKSGQTIVISGLVNQDLSNSVNKFPFLGDVPVLGTLFRSTNFRNGRTDLVIFVTPMVNDPAATLNQERLEKGKDMRERFQNQLGKKGIVD
jgi:pilus assembly protein CpaC